MTKNVFIKVYNHDFWRI